MTQTNREIVILTGLKGSFEYARILDKENSKDTVQFLRSKEIITEEEKLGLINMINSNDDENYIVAEEIIKQHLKAKIYDTKI
jgi:hypothetical protein